MIKISYVKEDTNKNLLHHHCHPEVEINIFLSGSGMYMVENKNYPVRAGDVFLMLGNMFHWLDVSNSEVEMNLIKIIFSPDDVSGDSDVSVKIYSELLDAFYKSSDRFDVRLPATSGYSSGIVRAAEQMWRDVQSGIADGGEKYLLAYILNSMKNHYLSKENQALITFDSRQYHDIMQTIMYIDENYADDISIDSLAQIAHLSVNRFIISFKQVMGITPGKYIISKRIAAASTLIAENRMKITEIAFECGFNSTANFNKAFLNITGMTPSEMRKKIIKSTD